MKEEFIFPFGQKVSKVRQKDRTPKEIFVLGVYASAVHAKWVGLDGKEKVKALAVASEPEIFWTGEGADDVIDSIAVPSGAGTLSPASPQYNGPSGRSLDQHFLTPLGLSRNDVWLCDLYPHAHLNPGQREAIAREYTPIARKYRLPTPTLPKAPSTAPSQARRDEIFKEIMKSDSRVLILLGDKPIHWFLTYYDHDRKKLLDFGKDKATYGDFHTVQILHKEFEVLPLVHPRQAGRLGKSSPFWSNLHKQWIEQKAPKLGLAK